MMGAQSVSELRPHSDIGRKETTIFRVPIGRLGLLSRVMVSLACGFITFFVAFVLAILGVAIYDSVKGISIANLNIAYLYIAAPAGIAVLLASFIYLVGAWVRGKFHSAH
jgi:hypothetical protein